MSVAKIAPGELEENVFQIRRAMQSAQGWTRGEVEQKFSRISHIAKRRLAADFDTLGKGGRLGGCPARRQENLTIKHIKEF